MCICIVINLLLMSISCTPFNTTINKILTTPNHALNSRIYVKKILRLMLTASLLQFSNEARRARGG